MKEGAVLRSLEAGLAEVDVKDLHKFAIAVVNEGTPADQAALRLWLKTLLEIRDSGASTSQKTSAAFAATLKSRAIWPMIKLIAAQIKKHGWDQRGTRTRWATVGGAIGFAAFGGQSAGIAALGSAIGVPLWVVFAGGAGLAKIILDEHASRAASTGGHNHGDPATLDGDYVDITPKR